MIEEKIRSLGIELPDAPASSGSYVQVVITGNLIFVSGQIPVEPGSIPMDVKFKGKVGKDISLEEGQEAARLCTINALAQLKSALGNLDKIRKILSNSQALLIVRLLLEIIRRLLMVHQISLCSFLVKKVDILGQR